MDNQGRTVDFVLRKNRGIQAAYPLFRKALDSNRGRAPRKVTLDGHVPSHQALRLLRREDKRWHRVHLRSCKLKASTRWLRHTHASLGHASLASTTAYVTTKKERRMRTMQVALDG